MNKLCKDCAYSEPSKEWPKALPSPRSKEAMCFRRIIGYSMVTGDAVYALCSEERESGSPMRCGMNAQFFTDKPEKPF